MMNNLIFALLILDYEWANESSQCVVAKQKLENMISFSFFFLWYSVAVSVKCILR